MNRAWIIVAVLLALVLPAVSGATPKGETLRYGGGGQGLVVFDGRGHLGRGFRCNDCHLDLFQTRRKGLISFADHFNDTRCFACHNDVKAPRDCFACHRRVPGSAFTAPEVVKAPPAVSR